MNDLLQQSQRKAREAVAAHHAAKNHIRAFESAQALSLMKQHDPYASWGVIQDLLVEASGEQALRGACAIALSQSGQITHYLQRKDADGSSVLTLKWTDVGGGRKFRSPKKGAAKVADFVQAWLEEQPLECDETSTIRGYRVERSGAGEVLVVRPILIMPELLCRRASPGAVDQSPNHEPTMNPHHLNAGHGVVQRLLVEADTMGALKGACEIALSQHESVTHFREDKDPDGASVLSLVWTNLQGGSPLAFPLQGVDEIAQFIANWLQRKAKYPSEKPDTDGSVERGFRIEQRDFCEVLSVKAEYIIHGK